MKRTTVACGVALLSATALFAEAPFGRLNGIEGGGNSGNGLIRLHGWALDDDGIAAVDVFVDGRIDGRTFYGKPRPEITAIHPSFPDSDAPGFTYPLDSTRYLNGNHEVTVRVTSSTGERQFLNALTIEILNTTHNLPPFGVIQFPNSNADLHGNCDVSDPNRRYSVVSGWALDAGVDEGDMGVGYVELLLDGAILFNDQLSCHFEDITGGLTNCYGLRTVHVEKAFPTLRNSPNAGYRFVLDVGALIDFGYSQGHHILTVRVGDVFTQVRNIDEIPVNFFCDENIDNEGSFGHLGRPLNGLLYSGLMEVVGWALDWEGIASVAIYVDGELNAFANLDVVRPDVTALYPGYPDSAAPGFDFLLDTTQLADGRHHLLVIAYDHEGESTMIGERTIVVDNPGV